MATLKSLQRAQIIEIRDSVIRVAHPDIRYNTQTNLAAPIAAAGTAMTVLDNHGFADDDWFLIGNIGDQETEENDVNGAVTRGRSVTVTNALKFDHEVNAPVTRIAERKITIYGAATDGGNLTAIKSTASPISIEWNKQYTEYALVTGDTAYAYYVVKFYDGTTEGAASEYIPSTGLTSNMTGTLIQQALDIVDVEVDENLTREKLVKWADDAQNRILSFSYQDPRSAAHIQMDWDFETIEDVSSLTTTVNQTEVLISSLSVAPKYTESAKAILGVRFGNNPMERIQKDEIDDLYKDTASTTVSVQAAIGDTTLTVVSNVLFGDSGTIYVGGDTVTYTAKVGTTGFSGIPAAGIGSITAIQAIGAIVWQGVSPNLPTKYAAFNDKIYFNIPAGATVEGYPIKITYLKKLTALTRWASTTDITFTYAFKSYIASKVEMFRGNRDEAAEHMAEFEKIVMNHALQTQPMNSDETVYHNSNWNI